MRRIWTIGLCALLAQLAPLFAADTYVPLAANTTLGASTYRTLLIATNTGGAPADLGVTFFPGGTDGTASQAQPSINSIPPGATLRLYNAVPAGARGMFRLTGPREIVVSARVEALGTGGAVLASAQVPVLPAANALAAGQRARLIGLEQTAGTTSDFGLMNLSHKPAQCTLEVFRAKGGRIGEAIRLAVLPRSSRDFSGALAVLGQTSIKDVRFDVSCDQTFGTYALVYRPGGPETVILGPAASLERDLTAPPPVEDGTVSFNLPGQFAVGNTFASYDLPLKDGVQYGHARIEFDLFVNRWLQTHPDNPNFKNVASFRRSAKSRSDRLLFWGLILKGSGDFRSILDMGMAPGAHDGLTIKSGKGPWKPRNSYHVVLDFDAEARRMVFEVYQEGQRVQRLEGPVVFTDIFNLPDKKVRVDFSSDGVGDGAYFPTTGWRYSNLTVKLTPRGARRSN